MSRTRAGTAAGHHPAASYEVTAQTRVDPDGIVGVAPPVQGLLCPRGKPAKQTQPRPPSPAVVGAAAGDHAQLLHLGEPASQSGVLEPRRARRLLATRSEGVLAVDHDRREPMKCRRSAYSGVFSTATARTDSSPRPTSAKAGPSRCSAQVQCLQPSSRGERRPCHHDPPATTQTRVETTSPASGPGHLLAGGEALVTDEH